MKQTRRYYCGNCQQPGHNRATCPDLPKKPKKATASWRATEWLRTHGGDGTLLDAAKRFRVTRQAVQQMWDARDLGPLPTQQKRVEIIASLAQYDGMTKREVAAQTGIHVTSRLAKEAGICLAPTPSLVDQIRPDTEELLPLIKSREITVTAAAHRLGVTPQILNLALKTLIDGPRKLSNRGRDYRAWTDGKSKSQRASELVDAGASVHEACARIGVASRGVYVYRKRKGEAAVEGDPMTPDEELLALRARVADLEAERDRMLPIYAAHVAEEQCRAEARDRELARVAALTEHELHCEQRHPDYEYATTENARKSGDTPKPPGEGWEENDIVRGPGVTSERWCNWTRGEYTETNYWRRRKPV